jgi:hypothetical protein
MPMTDEISAARRAERVFCYDALPRLVRVRRIGRMRHESGGQPVTSLAGRRACAVLVAALPLLLGAGLVSGPETTAAAESWTKVATVGDVGGYPVTIQSIACSSSTTCMAAGFRYSGSAPVGAVILETNNGWKTWASQEPSGVFMAEHVACPSSTDCFVTGTSSSTTAPRTRSRPSKWCN